VIENLSLYSKKLAMEKCSGIAILIELGQIKMKLT